MLKKIVFAFFILNLSFAQAAEDNPQESVAGPKRIVTACFACRSLFDPTLKEKHKETKYHLKKLSSLTKDTLLFKDVEVEITENKKCPRCLVIFSSAKALTVHGIFKPDCTQEPVPVTSKHQPEITNTPEDRLPDDLKRKILALSKMDSLGRATSEHQQKRKKSEGKKEAHLPNLMLPPTTKSLLDPHHDQLSDPLFDFGQRDCMAAQQSSTENQSFPVVDLDSKDFAQAAEDNPKESAGPKKIVTACFACASFFDPTIKEKHEKRESHLKKISELTKDTLLFKDVEVEITENKKCPRCLIIFSSAKALTLHGIFKPDCTQEPVPVTSKHQPEITNTPEAPLTKYFYCLACDYDVKEDNRIIHEGSKSHILKVTLLNQHDSELIHPKKRTKREHVEFKKPKQNQTLYCTICETHFTDNLSEHENLERHQTFATAKLLCFLKKGENHDHP